MTAQCSTTPDSIASVLLAGDVILNLSGRDLNAPAETPFLGESGGILRVLHQSHQVSWKPHFSPAVRSLISRDVTRVVVVGNEGQTDVSAVLQDLSRQAVPVTHCVLNDACDADAFMDEADAEAVAERLRQLGYL